MRFLGASTDHDMDSYPHAPTDQDMALYPHVLFTSPEEWDPSVLDHEYNDDEAQSWSFNDPDSFYEDHLFDNLNTLLDIPSNTGSYHGHSLIPSLTCHLHQSSSQDPDWDSSGFSLLGLLHLLFRTLIS